MEDLVALLSLVFVGLAFAYSEQLKLFFSFSNTGTSAVYCWYSYGLKEVNGVNRLSGAGLETQDSPGMLSGGGRWPGR